VDVRTLTALVWRRGSTRPLLARGPDDTCGVRDHSGGPEPISHPDSAFFLRVVGSLRTPFSMDPMGPLYRPRFLLREPRPRVKVVDSSLYRTCCRCFGSDRTPGVAPQGVFRSRTVSTTVAKWFVPIARGTVNKVYRFGPLRDA
jgi:hypothetical protein